MTDSAEKRCAHCGEVKPADAFSTGRRYRDGLSPWCRACHAEANRQWRRRNPDRMGAYKAARRIDPYAPRTCATCGTEFTPVRHDQRYCRRWCKQHAYLARIAT